MTTHADPTPPTNQIDELQNAEDTSIEMFDSEQPPFSPLLYVPDFSQPTPRASSPIVVATTRPRAHSTPMHELLSRTDQIRLCHGYHPLPGADFSPSRYMERGAQHVAAAAVAEAASDIESPSTPTTPSDAFGAQGAL